MKRLGLLLCTASLWVSAQSFAATYYVDSSNGNDSYSGQAENSAWRSLPRVNRTRFAPGDRILFRGEFRGSLDLLEETNGTQASPIVFDGESWGGQKARIIGAVPWNSTWTRCASASQVAGNPNFANIWYTTAPPDWSSDPSLHHFFKPIFENGEFLWFSTGPNLADPFLFEDYRSNYSVSPSDMTSTSIRDADVFTQSDPSFYDGAYIGIRDSGNLYDFHAVSGYSPSNHTIQISGSWSPYSGRETTYNILNHLAYLDRPGEYAYKYSENRIYIWPHNNGDPNGNSYETAQEKSGFVINGGRNITVRGFHFEGQHSLPGEYNGRGSAIAVVGADGAANLLIENNSIGKIRAMKYAGAIFLWNCADSVVQNNTVDYCQNSVGILAEGSRHIIVRDNRMDRVSKVGIWFQDLQDGQITRNVVRRVQGLHSNGISLYLGCSDILVAGNQVWQSQNPITFRDGSNFYFIGNVLDGLGAYSIAEWSGNMNGDVFILNNVGVNANASPDTRESNSSLYLVNDTSANYVIMNNVLDGMLVVEGAGGALRSHNIYTDTNYTQSPTRGGTLEEGEQVIQDLNLLFANAAQNNYSPASNSPLVNAGRDVSAYHPSGSFAEYDFSTDLAGNPLGSEFNIGAYEGPANSNPLPPSYTPPPVVFTPEPAGPTPTPTVTPTPDVVAGPTNTPVRPEPGDGQTVVTVQRSITDIDIADREAEIALEITVTGSNIDLTVVESYPAGLALGSTSPDPYFKQGTQVGWLLENTGSTTLRYKVHTMDVSNVHGFFSGYYWYQAEGEEIREDLEGPNHIEFPPPLDQLSR